MKYLFLGGIFGDAIMVVVGIAYNAPDLIIVGGVCGFLCSLGYNKYVKQTDSKPF